VDNGTWYNPHTGVNLMQEQNESAGLVRFGPFEVDMQAGVLRRHGRTVKLQDQPFQILALLLARPGEILRREEIKEKLWPPDTFVDFEHSIATAVKKLRMALGDDAESPRYVETVPRHGYRFIGALDHHNGRENSSPEALEEPPPSAAAKPLRRWPWIVAAALLIGALSDRSVSHFRQLVPEDRVFRFQITPPEGGQFVVGGASNIGGISLSPDGRTAAYVASANGKTGLWVRPLDGTTQRLVAGTERAGSPFWSPDGKSLAFFTATSKLQRVDLAGGTPSAICDGVSLLGGAWSADGRILFGSLVSGLFQVPASGGTPAPLTRLDASRGEFSHRWPQPLPDGRFLFLVQSWKPENTGRLCSFARQA
jgi:DNA-binding winged helix-turn-helix (wHTH) protein